MTTYTAADVNAWYNDIQYQSGATATVNAFVTQLNNGNISEDGVITAIINENYTTNYVNPILELYQAAFNHTPDSTGAAFWTGAFAAGTFSLATIADIFAGSAEFTAKYGNTSSADPISAATLNALYQNTYNTNAPASAIAYYVNQVPPLTVGSVLNTLATDPNFVAGSADAVTAFQYGQAYGNSSPSGNSGSLFEWAEITPANTIFIAAPGVYTVTGGNTEIFATQETFTANVVINGNHTIGNELKLIDTGNANWTAPRAIVSDIQEIELTNHSAPTHSEFSLAGIAATSGSGSVSVDGLTVYNSGTATTADIIYSLVTGEGTSTTSVSGSYANYHVASNANGTVYYEANNTGAVGVPTATFSGSFSGSEFVDHIGTSEHTDTINADNFRYAKSFSADNSTGAVVFDFLASGQELEIEGDKGQTVNGTVTAKWVDGVTSADVTVADGVYQGGDSDIVINGSSLKTVNFTSNTYDNELGGLDLASNVKTLNIRANTDLEFYDITGASLKSIVVTGDANYEPADPGALFGESAVELGDITALTSLKTIDASAMTRGGVSVSLTAGITKFLGGQGSDDVRVDNALSDSTATVNGNGGIDRLGLSDGVVNSVLQGAQYSGFDVIENNGNNGINFSYLNPTNTVFAVQLNNTSASAYGITALAALNVDFEQNSLNAGISRDTDLGTGDVLNLTAGGEFGNTFNVENLRISYNETVGFNNNGTGTNVLSFAQENTGLKTLNLTGNYGVDVNLASDGLAGGISQVDTLIKVDASGLGPNVVKGVDGIDLVDGKGGHTLTTSLSVTGSAGDDEVTFLGDLTALNQYDNQDTLSKGSSVNLISGGAGDDTLGATLDQLYTVTKDALGFDGGTGTNTLDIYNGNITTFAAAVSDTVFQNITNVTKLYLHDTSTNTVIGGPTGGGLAFQSGANFATAYANGVELHTGDSGAASSSVDLTAYTKDANITEVSLGTGNQTAFGGAGNDQILVGGLGNGAGSLVVKGGAGADLITVDDASEAIANYQVQITAGKGVDLIDQNNVGTVDTGAYSYVKDIFANGESTVGTPDHITGYYLNDTVAGPARLSDLLDLPDSAVVAAAVGGTTVSGFTSQQLQYHVGNGTGVGINYHGQGELYFTGTLAASTDVNTALVEGTVWTQVKAQIATHATIYWNDLNPGDVNANNTLVFNRGDAAANPVVLDSEVVLNGKAATVTGLALATDSALIQDHHILIG